MTDFQKLSKISQQFPVSINDIFIRLEQNRLTDSMEFQPCLSSARNEWMIGQDKRFDSVWRMLDQLVEEIKKGPKP